MTENAKGCKVNGEWALCDETKPGWLYCFLRTAVPFSSIKIML
jgi:hypothetical protein